MTTTIYDRAGRVVRSSRNLRGILAHSRGLSVDRVDLFRQSAGRTDGLLGVTWADGSSTCVHFASFTVMAQWVKARKCFKGATIKGLPA